MSKKKKELYIWAFSFSLETETIQIERMAGGEPVDLICELPYSSKAEDWASAVVSAHNNEVVKHVTKQQPTGFSVVDRVLAMAQEKPKAKSRRD